MNKIAQAAMITQGSVANNTFTLAMPEIGTKLARNEEHGIRVASFPAKLKPRSLIARQVTVTAEHRSIAM